MRKLKEDAEAVKGEKIEEAVVTVPAYFYHKERAATMEAAKRAGLNVKQIINEPTAAALCFGVSHFRENAKVLVYDLGGGTFDVTLIQMLGGGQIKSLQTNGNHFLGGKDWDEALIRLVAGKIESETGFILDDDPELRRDVQDNAEAMKKALSSRSSASITVNVPDYGRLNVEVSLEEFESETSSLLEQTGALCESLLRQLHYSWRDVDDVLLVGGSTRMRQVPKYLQSKTGKAPLSQVNPDEAVALGAAIQVNQELPEYGVVRVGGAKKKANFFSGPISKVTVGKETSFANALQVRQRDVVAHAMGVIAVNAEGTEYINKTIIPANQQIPVKCAESFHFMTSKDGDNEMEIYVLQGSKQILQCQIIGKYVVTGIQHRREDNPTTIRIQYSYDVNGMIHVQARQGDSDKDLPIREEPVPADMSKYGRPVEKDEMMKNSVAPLSIVFAIDTSGSMYGEPIEDALDAIGKFIDQVIDYPGELEVGAISVADRSIIEVPLRDPRKSDVKGLIRRKILKSGAGVGNSGQPFDDILKCLANKDGQRIALVLADGMWYHQPFAVRRAKECHKKEITIVGIGFGSADKKFLKDISNGEFDPVMLASSSELVASFGKIAQEISSSGNSKKAGDTGGSRAPSETWLAIGERKR